MTLDRAAGRMALFGLCENGDLQGVKAALGRGEDVNRIWQRGDCGLPSCPHRPDCDFKALPLQAAIKRNHVGIVGLLLQQPGIDVNLQIFGGHTPLHMACMFGRTKIVRMLLTFPGTDPHIPNEMGRIPLMEAFHHGHKDCLIEMVQVATKDELVELMNILPGAKARWIIKYLLNNNSKYTEEEKALQQEKEMKRLEEKKKRKEEEKKKIGQGKGRNARKRKKEERRKREEEEALLQNTDDTLEDQNKVHYEENDQSKEEVKGSMIRAPMNKGLMEFIDRQILDLEEELECPVCLEVASIPPIFKCPDDHLICRWVVAVSM